MSLTALVKILKNIPMKGRIKMKVLISGLMNVETTIPVKEFPIDYSGIEYPFFGINSNVSGVGYNLAKAFLTLGDVPDMISYLGKDLEGDTIIKQLEKDDISSEGISRTLKNTPVSTVLFDRNGKRQIFCDLKDIQEQSVDINDTVIQKKLNECDMVCACNINFSRTLMQRAFEMKKTIATDVHALSNVYDIYNKDFIMKSNILFMSDEKLPAAPEKVIEILKEQHDNEVIVIGMGSKGAMLFDREFDSIYRFGATRCENIVNTVGAGDALFSSFVHYYSKGMNCIDALKRAETFAAIKIQHNGASVGFGTERDVETALKYADISVTKL